MVKINISKEVIAEFNLNFQQMIAGLLEFVPKEDLVGLESINIEYESSYPDSKIKVNGYYCGRNEGYDVPAITICMKNLLGGVPRFMLYLFPFVPRIFLAEVLYHEIAHHHQRLYHGYQKKNWEKHARIYSNKLQKVAFQNSDAGRFLLKCRSLVLPFVKLIRKNAANT